MAALWHPLRQPTASNPLLYRHAPIILLSSLACSLLKPCQDIYSRMLISAFQTTTLTVSPQSCHKAKHALQFMFNANKTSTLHRPLW